MFELVPKENKLSNLPRDIEPYLLGSNVSSDGVTDGQGRMTETRSGKLDWFHKKMREYRP